MNAKVKFFKNLFMQLVMGKFSIVQIVRSYSTVLIIGIGGTLYLMRLMTDDYMAIPANFASVGFISLMWVLALVLFVGLGASLHFQNRLFSKDAGWIGLCLTLGIFFAWATPWAFHDIPRDHFAEQQSKLTQLLADMNTHMPIRINEFVTVKNMALADKTITFLSTIDEKEGYYWDEKAMRETLLKGSCPYFVQYSLYGNVMTIIHQLSSSHQNFTITFKQNDCAPGANASTPAIVR